MERINGAMRINEVLEIDDNIIEVFVENGLNCLGCPGAASESLAEAAEGHGVDLEKLLGDLKEYMEKRK